MKLTKGEKIFQVINNIILIVFALVCLLPMLNILARSLSGVSAVAGGKVWMWPVDFSLRGWKYILQRTSFLGALGSSVFITSIGTGISVFVTILTAYSLSKHHLKGRMLFAYIYLFFFIFDAGILPKYFLMKEYNLLNNIWVLILPNVIKPYYMFVLKTAFENVPEALEEAARIDGASNTRILFTIVMPIMKASITTIIVFYSVNYWNKYFDALMYITKPSLKPITLFLYELIKMSSTPDGLGEVELAATVSPEIMQASAVVLAIMPILMVYPFMQKHFVKGIMIGSVKG